MKYLLIINPLSHKIYHSLDLFQYLDDYDIYYTKGTNDIYDKLAHSLHFDTLIVLGGDGTVNEVICALKQLELSIPLLIVPTGTMNDFASTLHLSCHTKHIYPLLKNQNIQSFPLGKIGNNYFLNICSGGLFSHVSYTISSRMKKLGSFGYYLHALMHIHELKKTYHLQLTIDNQHIQKECLLFLVCNSHRVAGFKHLHSYPLDCFHIFLISPCTLLEFCMLLKDYLCHQHLHNPHVFHYSGKQVSIACKEDINVNIDGECGPKLPVDIHYLPSSINIYTKK